MSRQEYTCTDMSIDPTRICQICLVLASETSKYYQHYGAICCLGCKAFFRRVFRDEIQTDFVCKRNGTCDLRLMRCKHCRLRRCLQVGLHPGKILNEEERKKYTHPKKAILGRQDGNVFIGSQSVAHSEESGFESLNHQNYLMNEQLTMEFNRLCQELPIQQNVLTKIFHGHLYGDFGSEYIHGLRQILQSFDDFTEKFAQKNFLFQTFPVSDQTTLLKHNRHLYKMFILAQFLISENGHDQLSILSRTESIKSGESKHKDSNLNCSNITSLEIELLLRSLFSLFYGKI